MKEKLSRTTSEAVRQIIEDFSVEECQELQKELVLGEGQTFRKGQASKYSNTGWKYLYSEFEKLHYWHQDRGLKKDIARTALANIVVWNRVGNCLKAYHTIPKTETEYLELEKRWLEEHGLSNFCPEPMRAIHQRMKRLK